jgi:uncharacterized heparinase superfamily protein
MFERLTGRWRRTAADRSPELPAPAPLPSLRSDTDAIGVSPTDWCRRRRERSTLYSSVPSETIARLRERHGGRVDATIAGAERVLQHEFDLLGSGPYVPRDPDRSAADGYAPIDWYVDPVRRLRFPRGVPYKQWNLLEMRPQNADVKYPWELARCQHWPVLGQAYRFTHDDRFAIEIARELDDFVESNPTGIGINWTCTMDVGLRAANWAIAFELVHASTSLDEAFWARAYSALFDHSVFIRNNLENTYEVTSNHYLSNLLGLLFVGAAFDDLPQGVDWAAFARAAIEQEMQVQVLDDGADYESSIPYHRLVTELFLGAARLAELGGHPLSSSYRARLRDMVAYLAAVTRPDGLMPQVGDADDGRLHMFEGYAATTPQDPRHLFGPAGAMFGEPAWVALGGEAGRWEAAWWGLATDSEDGAAHPVSRATLFPKAGIAVARNDAGDYLLITNGIVGTNGFGNHKHNDLLAFEYHRRGAPLLVDPGSHVYTSDPDSRNRFRGTAYHNTVMIDGVEQNELRPDWLFRLFETSHAETTSFHERGNCVEYVGRHHGYERLPQPITHERTFRFDKPSGKLSLVDRFIGRGRHRLQWHFHLAPGVEARRLDAQLLLLSGPQGGSTFSVPGGLTIDISAAAYSPAYGVKLPCSAIDLSIDVEVDEDRLWEFSVAP